MARDDRIEEMQKTILILQEEIERLSQPPYLAGTVLQLGDRTARLVTDGGGFHEVEMPSEKGLNKKFRSELKPGSKVILNSLGAMIGYSEFETPVGGDIVTVDEIADGRLRVQVKGESRMVLNNLKGVKVGDEVQLDGSGLLATERFDRKKTRYALESIPQAPWTNIGGLESTICQIRSEVEEPFLHKDIFCRYGRKPAKGILLYGPPGCGKTMIAKSIAYNLAVLSGNGTGHFISVKGPEILDKFVGNSEANIRRIYSAARDEAEDSGVPTVVFIDEAESIMKTRGSGISTDVYDSIVPQFLAEMDGMNGDYDVITVLATNREDIIDPAVLRDGRVDRRIKVPRPNREGAKQIFEIYLRGKPLKSPNMSENRFSESVVKKIYDDEDAAYKVSSPERLIGYFRYENFVSGAMIKGIVDRACGYAIQREIKGERKGLDIDDLYSAADEEFNENSGFAQALVRDDWEVVFGSEGRHYYELCKRGYLYLERANNHAKNTERRHEQENEHS